MMYIDGGAGPGVPKTPGVERHDLNVVRDRMDGLVASVAWEKVRTFALYETERDPDGVGKGLFPEGWIRPIPDHLAQIVSGGRLDDSQEDANYDAEPGSGDELWQ